MQLRVLLVDDHPLVRAGLKSLIESQPDMCVVGEAEDGLVSIDMAERTSPDVIVMDLSMPKLGGAQATERIKHSNANARVLALTAFEDRGYLQLLMEAGASGFVLKRSAAEDLVRALRTIAMGGTYIDPAVPPEMFANGRRTGDSQPCAPLSERESEVLQHSAQGRSMKETAAALDLGVRTVETYKARAMEKLQLRNRAELVRYALKRGWLRDG